MRKREGKRKKKRKEKRGQRKGEKIRGEERRGEERRDQRKGRGPYMQGLDTIVSMEFTKSFTESQNHRITE